METQHWVSEALAYGYISATDVTPLSSALVQIGRMLNSMTEKADSFCGSPEGEPDALMDQVKMTLLGVTGRGLGKGGKLFSEKQPSPASSTKHGVFTLLPARW